MESVLPAETAAVENKETAEDRLTPHGWKMSPSTSWLTWEVKLPSRSWKTQQERSVRLRRRDMQDTRTGEMSSVRLRRRDMQDTRTTVRAGDTLAFISDIP